MASPQDGSQCFTNPKYIENNVLVAAVSVTVGLGAAHVFLANGTVFLAIVRTMLKNRCTQRGNSHNKNSYVTQLFMVSMSLSGVLSGAFVMPLAMSDVISNNNWTLGATLYKIRIAGDYLLYALTTIHITFMAIDTYILVCRPLIYRLLPAKTGYLMISIGWIVPVIIITTWCLQQNNLLQCSQYNDKNNGVINFNVTFGSLLLVNYAGVSILYLLVLKDIVRFRNRHLSGAKVTNSETSSKDFSHRDDSESKVALGMSQRKFRRNVKCFRFIGMVLLNVSICWLPTYCLLAAFTSAKIDLPGWAFLFINLWTYFSCCVNPYLYSSNKSIYLAVRNLIC